MSRPETKASFTGAVSFVDRNAAAQFRDTVSDILDFSSRVFWEMAKDPMLPGKLSRSLDDLEALLPHFAQMARYYEYEDAASASERFSGTLAEHSRSVKETLANARPGQEWNLKEAEKLTSGMQGVLSHLGKLIDINEDNVIRVTLENIQMCRKATTAAQTAESYIEKHVANFDNVVGALKEQVDNRATVVQDDALPPKLRDLSERVGRAQEAFTSIVRRAGTHEQRRGRGAEMFGLLDEAQALFTKMLSAADFTYNSIDESAFNSALDSLFDSLQNGDTSSFKDNARALGSQVKGLNSAADALKEQTKALLAASKDALKNKDSEDAANHLAGLMAGLKAQAADQAAREREERKRRDALLRAAGQIGLSINHMQDDLTRLKEGRGPAPARSLDLSAGLERAIRADEDDRIAKLDARTPSSSSASASSTASSSALNVDDELDGLLDGLDDLVVEPEQPWHKQTGVKVDAHASTKDAAAQLFDSIQEKALKERQEAAKPANAVAGFDDLLLNIDAHDDAPGDSFRVQDRATGAEFAAMAEDLASRAKKIEVDQVDLPKELDRMEQDELDMLLNDL